MSERSLHIFVFSKRCKCKKRCALKRKNTKSQDSRRRKLLLLSTLEASSSVTSSFSSRFLCVLVLVMTSVFQWGSLSYSSAPFSLFHAPYEFLHLTHPFASSIRRPLALHRVACSQRGSWDCGPAEGPMYVGRTVKQWSPREATQCDGNSVNKIRFSTSNIRPGRHQGGQLSRCCAAVCGFLLVFFVKCCSISFTCA